MRGNSWWIGAFAAGLSFWLFLIGGCGRQDDAKRVVLYSSVDKVVLGPIVEEFERRTGLKVILLTDTEATKTAALAERLEAERDNPQADVWWCNEPFHTIHLAEVGVLAAYESPAAREIPALYKDSGQRWAGTGLRVRVIARTRASAAGETAAARVRSIHDLADPALKGRVCMANPIAGTTRGHMAALYTLWGPAKTEEFFAALAANEIKLLGGNSVVAEMVSAGTMWAGLTDNDDVDAMLAQNGKLDMVVPDQGPDQIGALAIPCTVGLVAGAKRPENARLLVDYLLSREVEQKLLDAKFASHSVFAPAGEGKLRPMEVDFSKVAANLKPATEMALRILAGRK